MEMLTLKMMLMILIYCFCSRESNVLVNLQRSHKQRETKRDLFKVDTRLGAPPLRRELEEEVEVDHVVPLLLLLPADHDFLLQAARNFHPREFLPRQQQPQLPM